MFVHNHAVAFLVLGVVLLLGKFAPDIPALGFAIFAYFTWYAYRSMRVVYGQGRMLTVSKLALLAFFYLVFASLLLAATSIYSVLMIVKEFAMRTVLLRRADPCRSACRRPARRRSDARGLLLSARLAGRGPKAYIISPKDGAKVHGPVLVQFGLKGMGIAPAGVKMDNTGHHHLLIDTEAPVGPERAAAGDGQDRALRQGPDRDHAAPLARQAHAAAAAR